MSTFSTVRANVEIGINHMATKLATQYAKWTHVPSEDLKDVVPVMSYNIKVAVFNIATVAAVALLALGIITVISLQAAIVASALFILLRYVVNNDLKETAMELNDPQMQGVSQVYQRGQNLSEFEALQRAGLVPRDTKENAFMVAGQTVWKNFIPLRSKEASAHAELRRSSDE